MAQSRPHTDKTREGAHVYGIDHLAPLFRTVPDVVDEAFCAAFIARMEAVGFDAAPITTEQGFEMRPDIRNNTRVMSDDVETATWLWERVRAYIPPVVHHKRATGLNERLRCYRYTPGQRFAPHYDGAFCRDGREQSFYTLLFYLNDDFRGGATALYDVEETIAPTRGGMLLFQHGLLHEGCAVEAGTKYVLRTDVMYR